MEEEKIIIDYDMIIAAKSGSMQVLKPPTFALLLTVLPVHK